MVERLIGYVAHQLSNLIDSLETPPAASAPPHIRYLGENVDLRAGAAKTEDARVRLCLGTAQGVLSHQGVGFPTLTKINVPDASCLYTCLGGRKLSGR